MHNYESQNQGLLPKSALKIAKINLKKNKTIYIT